MREADSYRNACAHALREHDRDLFLCALAAPGAVRDGLTALYAFNAEITRAAETSSEALIAQMRLKWWYDALDAIFDGNPPHHPVAQALAEAAAGGLDKAVLRGVIEALADADDLDGGEYDPERQRLRADATLVPVFGQALRLAGAAGRGAEDAVQAAARAWGLVSTLRRAPVPPAHVPALHAEALVQRRRAGRPKGKAAPVLAPVVLADIYLARIAKAGFDLGHPLARRADPGAMALPRLWWAARF